MKTARLTLLTTPEFKAFLGAEAARGGISVAELVRSRCEQRQTDDEAVLASLAVELRQAVRQASAALKGGLAEADAVLAELRSAPAPLSAPHKRRKAAAA